MVRDNSAFIRACKEVGGEFRRDFKGEPHTKISLYGIEEITPKVDDMTLGMIRGKKDNEEWIAFIRYGKIWFKSGGVTGSLKYGGIL